MRILLRVILWPWISILRSAICSRFDPGWPGRFTAKMKALSHEPFLQPAIYTVGSLSLALLENLVRTNNRQHLSSCIYLYADIPEEVVCYLKVSSGMLNRNCE